MKRGSSREGEKKRGIGDKGSVWPVGKGVVKTHRATGQMTSEKEGDSLYPLHLTGIRISAEGMHNSPGKNV